MKARCLAAAAVAALLLLPTMAKAGGKVEVVEWVLVRLLDLADHGPLAKIVMEETNPETLALLKEFRQSLASKEVTKSIDIGRLVKQHRTEPKLTDLFVYRAKPLDKFISDPEINTVANMFLKDDFIHSEKSASDVISDTFTGDIAAGSASPKFESPLLASLNSLSEVDLKATDVDRFVSKLNPKQVENVKTLEKEPLLTASLTGKIEVGDLGRLGPIQLKGGETNLYHWLIGTGAIAYCSTQKCKDLLTETIVSDLLDSKEIFELFKKAKEADPRLDKKISPKPE